LVNVTHVKMCFKTQFYMGYVDHRKTNMDQFQYSSLKRPRIIESNFPSLTLQTLLNYMLIISLEPS
jgi:hypothetical protein